MSKASIRLLPLVSILLFTYLPTAHAQDSYMVGIYHNPPLVSFEKGLPSGFLVELLSHIASKANWNITFVYCEWTECLDRLEKGSIDLLLPVAYSAQREEKFDLGKETLLINWGNLYCSKNFRMNDMESLKGANIVLVPQDIYTHAFQDMIKKIHIHELNYIHAKDYEEVFRTIEAGQADCGVASRIAGLVFIERYKSVYATGISSPPIELRIAATKNKHRDTLRRIDAQLSDLKNDTGSIYYELMNKWIFKTQSLNQLGKWVKWSIAALSLTLLILTSIILILRSIINKKTRSLSLAIENLQIQLKHNEKLRQALEEERSLKQTIIDNLQTGVVLADEQGRIVNWNVETYRWFADIEDKASKKGYLWELFLSETEEQIRHCFHQALEGVAADFELEAKSGAGKSQITRVFIRKIELISATYVLMLLQDVTELKELVRFYENKWAFLQNIVDQMPLPLFIVDSAGKVIVWNEASERTTGMTKQQVLNHPLDLSPIFFGGKKILIPALLLIDHEPLEIERLTNGKIKVSPEFRETVETFGWIWVKEQKRYVKILASRLRDADGNIIGYFQCARDITDEINLQRTLAEAQKAETVSHLTSAFTHELHNIFTIILGVCDIISVESDHAPNIEPYIGIIRDTINRATTLSTYFQRMGRHDESILDKRSLNDIVNDILNPLLPLLRDNINLTYHFDPQVGIVHVSRTELESVIFRLLIADREKLSLPKNISIKTTKKILKLPIITPDVRIPTGTYAVLLVSYNGLLPHMSSGEQPGLEPEEVKIDYRTNQKTLFSSMQRMVEQAGGFMVVETTESQINVEIWFPTKTEETVESYLSKTETLKGKTIFILEDDQFLLKTIQTSLQLHGASVVESLSLDEARLRWWQYSNTIDLAILDVVLPEGSSSSIFQLMRADRKDLPVLFISGYDKSIVTKELTEMRVLFLQKPFSIHQLVSAIVELLSPENSEPGEEP